MNFRLLLLFSFFGFVIIGESQTENKVDKQFSEADYLFENQKYKEAYFAYQTIEKQKTELDSLEKGKLYLGLCACAEKLENFPEAIAFHMQARQFVPFTNQKENQYYIDRVESVLPTETDSLSLSRLYYRFAVLLVKEGNREASFPYFFKALDLAKGLKHYAAVATIANDIAGEYWDVGNGLLSTKMYEEAVSAAIRSGDSNRIAGAYLNLAGNYTDQGDFQTGIKIHLKALSIKEKIADSSRLSYYYQSAASIYYELRDYKNWEEYAQKAYQLNRYEYARSLLDKASVYGILGGIANRKNQVNTALRYYDTLLILSKEIASENGQKTALDNQSKIYKEQGKYDVALELLTQSEAFLTDNPYYHISHRNTKAELYQSLKKPKEALQLLLLNTKESSLNNYSFEKLRTFRLLYEVNTQLAAYQEAFRWNDSLRLLENMLRDADVRKDIAELETQYQTEKKEQQISLLTAENELKNQRMQQAFLLIGFLLVLVSLILFLLYFRRKQAAFKQSELQQQLLRSQMNPHFIFNVMGSIQGFLYKNEASKAADYLSRFASLSRSVLNFSSQEKISLKEEIEMLQNYIELERARMENPFEIEYKIPEDLETEFIEIPPMLLQPFVENAIKHGFKNIDYQGKLRVCFKETEGYIAVEILDNGKGLSLEKDPLHQSKALEIFKQRKKGIEHKFKKELTFDFQNLKDFDEKKHGIRVFIKLPILNND